MGGRHMECACYRWCCSGGWIVDRTDHPRFGEGLIVLDEDQIDHQLDHFARGEVFPGGLVRDFRELADQFLEN